MKYLICLFCLSFSAIVFSQKNDTAIIIQVLKSDYGTMLSMDLKKHMSNCTEDYLLLEAGETWNMEQESKWYKDDANKVADRKDNLDFKYIRIDGNFAYAVYHLRSDITKEGKLTQKNRNESTISKSEWRMEDRIDTFHTDQTITFCLRRFLTVMGDTGRLRFYSINFMPPYSGLLSLQNHQSIQPTYLTLLISY